MSAIDKYYSRISEIMSDVFEKEHDAMERAAQAIADANENGRSIFGFGCNHAGLITLELFYRSGGMVTINPIRAPGMMLEISPPTMTSEMERMLGYGKIILDNEPAKEGDVLLLAGKGHETYIIDKEGTHYFSEKDVVMNFIKEKSWIRIIFINFT